VINILVTTDGSQPSRRVLPHALRFAAGCGGRITLLRVLNPLLDLAGELATHVEAAAARVREEWRAALEASLAASGVEGTGLVATQQHGEDTHDAILRAAGEQQAAVIAMHSRGAGALRHALLGSVAMGVLGGSEHPVLLTSEREEAPSHEGTYRLLMTSDGSASSLAIVRALPPLIEGQDVSIKLIRVCEPRSGRPGPEAEQESCRHQLESVRRRLLPAGLSCECDCAAAANEQPTAQAIVEAALGAGADAIAMSTHGHGALHHLLAGSVALDVLERSPLPVILARSRE
jgi:nucleotide-binding universal stress UspA family protein